MQLYCKLTYASMRAQPKHTAPMVSQVLLGAPLIGHYKSQDNKWLWVEALDRYTGWVEVGAVSTAEKIFSEATVFVRVTTMFGMLTPNSPPLHSMPVLAGSILALHGQQLYTPMGQAVVFNGSYEAVNQAKPTPQSILKTAQQFLGVPYLWGGTTPIGLDCSGLVQLVFALNNQQLPRDAYQQAELGKTVPNQISELQMGDLLYFAEKEKISHIAIATGRGGVFLHASEVVQFNSLAPNDKNFAPHRAQTWVLTKRLF